MLRKRLIPLFLAFGLLPGLSGCETNPATGQTSLTGLMSTSEEAKIGREQHPQILAEFGGAYDDPALQKYISSLGQLLASTSERKDVTYTFTVLDSPIVNAFAVPGGYIYITRGLLALADNEAEVAGVLSHEIGHITARHSAQQYSRSTLANIGAVALGVLTGSGAVANLAGSGAAVWLQGYSRDQEFQADQLGVRYMSRAGYDPQAMASFLSKLEANTRLEATIAGHPETADQTDIMATHPRTLDRVQRAIAEAKEVGPVKDPMTERDIYLNKIDGILYGDDPKEGLIEGRRFVHPGLRIAFEVPKGFNLINGAKQVTAIGPQESQIVFDRAPQDGGAAMTSYLADEWGRKLGLQDVERITVNGMEGATGSARVQTNHGAYDARLVAIRAEPGAIYRFMFLTQPQVTAELSDDLRRTTYSFRRLSAQEAGQVHPQRIQVVAVKAGDTVESLAQRMPFETYREERFRVLNGLTDNDQLQPGQRVKIISQ